MNKDGDLTFQGKPLGINTIDYESLTVSLPDEYLKEFAESFKTKLNDKIARDLNASLNYCQIVDPSGNPIYDLNATSFWTSAKDDSIMPEPMKFHRRYETCRCHACGLFFKPQRAVIQDCPHCGETG